MLTFFILLLYQHVTGIVQSHGISAVFGGQFRLHSENQRIKSTFKSLKVSSLNECQNQCVLYQGLCKSYNFMDTDQLCELSTDTSENESYMEESLDWVHYEIDVSPKYRGKGCVSKSACPERDYCESKSSYPYYECLCNDATFNTWFKSCPKENLCQNGGNCVETCNGMGHRCECLDKSRFTGMYCQIDLLDKCSIETACYPCHCDLDENLNPICNCAESGLFQKPVYHIPFDTYDEVTKTTFYSIGVNENNTKNIQLDNQAQSIIYDEAGKGLVLHLKSDLELGMPAEGPFYSPLTQAKPFVFSLWVQVFEFDTSTINVEIFKYGTAMIKYRNIDANTICFVFTVNEYAGYVETYYGIFSTGSTHFLRSSLSYWTHVVLVWYGNSLSGYVNGTLSGEDTAPYTYTPQTIIEAEDGKLTCKDCYISNLAIWNNLLNVDQINRLYEQGIPKKLFVIKTPLLSCKDAALYCLQRGKTLGKFQDKTELVQVLTDADVTWVFAGCKKNENNEMIWNDGTSIHTSFSRTSNLNDEGPCCEMKVTGLMDDEQSTTKQAFVCQ